MPKPSDGGWRRSSFCDGSESNPVFVKSVGGAFAVADRPDPDGPALLVFTGSAWRAFVAGVRNGEFDR
jgi:Domain of unknown function (DUF397)